MSSIGKALGFGGGPPKAPNYTAAAEQTAASDLAAIRAQTAANRMNQYGPFGSLTYQQTGPDSWTQNSSLDPRIMSAYSQTLDNPYLDLPVNPGETYTDATMRLMEPIYGRQEEQNRTRLANQGVMEGSEAYTNAMQDLSDQQNRSRLQAVQTGVDKDISTEQLRKSFTPNLLASILSGGKVAMPGFSQQGNAGGTDYLNAAGAQYGAKNTRYGQEIERGNSQLGGLMSVGQFFSDRRLKSHIVLKGVMSSGLPFYEYTIFGKREIGVMAQDVAKMFPDAIRIHGSGYMMVDYAAIH